MKRKQRKILSDIKRKQRKIPWDIKRMTKREREKEDEQVKEGGRSRI
jgi:hypothetical protein